MAFDPAKLKAMAKEAKAAAKKVEKVAKDGKKANGELNNVEEGQEEDEVEG